MKQTILNTKQGTLLENLIVKHGQIVTSEQIYSQAESLRDHQRAKKTITELTHNGWLIRVKRGLYAISDLIIRVFFKQKTAYEILA